MCQEESADTPTTWFQEELARHRARKLVTLLLLGPVGFAIAGAGLVAMALIPYLFVVFLPVVVFGAWLSAKSLVYYVLGPKPK